MAVAFPKVIERRCRIAQPVAHVAEQMRPRRHETGVGYRLRRFFQDRPGRSVIAIPFEQPRLPEREQWVRRAGPFGIGDRLAQIVGAVGLFQRLDQVDVGLYIIGLDLQGLAIAGYGFFGSAKALQRTAQIVMGLRIVRPVGMAREIRSTARSLSPF